MASTNNYVGNIQSFNAPAEYGVKNRIINGGMDLDQRNVFTSKSTNVPLSTTGYAYIADRWLSKGVVGTGSSPNSLTMVSQVIDIATAGKTIPAELVAKKCMKINMNSGQYVFSGATSAPDAYSILYPVEGIMMTDFKWGTANGKAITFSFWWSSTYVGDSEYFQNRFCVSFGNATNNCIYRKVITPVSQAEANSTWQKVVITVPAPPVGSVWNTDTQVGMYINIGFVDTTSSATTINSWDQANSSYMVSDGIARADAMISAEEFSGAFYLTQVQLEIGYSASLFEFRPYFTELDFCRRYYEKSYDADTAPATIVNDNMVQYGWNSTNRPLYTVNYSVPKRTGASPVIYNPITGTAGQMRNIDASTNVSAVLSYTGTNRFGVYNSGAGVAGQFIGFHYAVNADYV